MRHAPTTRFSLIARLGDAEDQAAWGEFVRLYEPAIYCFARGRGMQDADAREIVQEVFMHVNKMIASDQVRSIESFRAWLSVVARNRVVDLVRRSQKHRNLSHGFSDQFEKSIDESPASIEQSWEYELRHQMFAIAADQVRQQVSETQWLAFFHTAIEMQPASSVAQRLGMSVGNVYVARCRIIHRIRLAVERLTCESDPSGENR